MVRAGLAGKRPSISRVSVLALAAVLLAGCEGGGGLTSPREASRAGAGLDLAAPVGARAVERDVPAPERFQQTERGLWDGRPSLGGVWVAHPDAVDPERVLIRNSETGAEVIGALFRRERENPGPRFQISSEAASELGILAGQPAEISVVALRLERIEPRAEARPAETETESEAQGVTDAGRRAEPSELAETPRTGSASAASATAPAPRPDRVAPETATAAGSVEIAPVAAPDAAGTEPAPRRGLRDFFRRTAPETESPGAESQALVQADEIRATPLEPAAPAAAQGATDEPAVLAPTAAAASSAASERSWRRQVAGAPLSGTAFLGAVDAPETARPAAERRNLRDLFRRRPEEPRADDTLIPLPETED